MSARAESEYIPIEEDAITKSMYKITVTVIKQTLLQSDAQQPVITGSHCGASLAWLKMQPSEVTDACALMQRDGDNDTGKGTHDEQTRKVCMDILEQLATEEGNLRDLLSRPRGAINGLWHTLANGIKQHEEFPALRRSRIYGALGKWAELCSRVEDKRQKEEKKEREVVQEYQPRLDKLALVWDSTDRRS